MHIEWLSLHITILNAIYSCGNPRTRAHERTWELSEEPDDVGGRFEKAYLRMDRGAGCSCGEMIYMDTNPHMLTRSSILNITVSLSLTVTHSSFFRMFTSTVIFEYALHNLQTCSQHLWYGKGDVDNVLIWGWCIWLRLAVKSSCGHWWTLKIPAAHGRMPHSLTTLSHQSPYGLIT